jgi:hypothetical protein
MRSWLLRRRHQLRALYGLPPEERLRPLLEAARGEPKRPEERAADEPERARPDAGRAGWLWPRRQSG